MFSSEEHVESGKLRHESLQRVGTLDIVKELLFP
jgi:hypothetical protein